MPSMSLQQIREAADARFGPYIITGVEGGDVTLLNALRLPKEQKATLVALQNRSSNADDNGDDDATLREMVAVLAANSYDAERLLAAVGDDNAALAVILDEYRKATQLGEASPSQS